MQCLPQPSFSRGTVETVGGIVVSVNAKYQQQIDQLPTGPPITHTPGISHYKRKEILNSRLFADFPIAQQFQLYLLKLQQPSFANGVLTAVSEAAYNTVNARLICTLLQAVSPLEELTLYLATWAIGYLFHVMLNISWCKLLEKSTLGVGQAFTKYVHEHVAAALIGDF